MTWAATMTSIEQGLRYIEENGDTYEAGTRMPRAYQQAGRQTPVSDDEECDQPVRETQDRIYVDLTGDAALTTQHYYLTESRLL